MLLRTSLLFLELFQSRACGTPLHKHGRMAEHNICACLQFVADGVFYAELNELLTRELAEHGYSGVEVRVTPMRTEIIIRATRTQNVLGALLLPPFASCIVSVRRRCLLNSPVSSRAAVFLIFCSACASLPHGIGVCTGTRLSLFLGTR